MLSGSLELRTCVVVLMIVCGLTPVVFAEEIVLTTGEVLEAAVVEVSDEAVGVDHPVLGRLTIPRAGVTAIDGRPLEPILNAAA